MGCSVCGKFSAPRNVADQKFCDPCFQSKFGNIVLLARGLYYGGHTAYPIPHSGISRGMVGGDLYLTNKYLIFSKSAVLAKNKWAIIIPFESIIINYWNKSELTIPYEGEDGEMQRPKFKAGATSKKSFETMTAEWIERFNDILIEFQQRKSFAEHKNRNRGITKPETSDRENVKEEYVEKPKEVSLPKKNKLTSSELYALLKKGEITEEEYTKAILKLTGKTEPEEQKKVLPFVQSSEEQKTLEEEFEEQKKVLPLVQSSESSEADSLKKEIEMLKEKLEIRPKRNVKPKKSKGEKKSREEILEEYEKNYLEHRRD